VQTGHLWQLSW